VFDPRPIPGRFTLASRLIHVNPSAFGTKNCEKFVIHFAFGPLTGGIGGQPSTGGQLLGRVIDDIINRGCRVKACCLTSADVGVCTACA